MRCLRRHFCCLQAELRDRRDRRRRTRRRSASRSVSTPSSARTMSIRRKGRAFSISRRSSQANDSNATRPCWSGLRRVGAEHDRLALGHGAGARTSLGRQHRADALLHLALPAALAATRSPAPARAATRPARRDSTSSVTPESIHDSIFEGSSAPKTAVNTRAPNRYFDGSPSSAASHALSRGSTTAARSSSATPAHGPSCSVCIATTTRCV